MRPRTLLPLSTFLFLASAFRLDTSPFTPAILESTPFNLTNSTDSPAELSKRQTCPANYNSCSGLSNLNSASNCCAGDSVCALDNAGNIACCPLGSFCTGVITTISPTTTTPSPIIATTISSGIIVTMPPTPTPTPTPTTIATGQYVQNTFYPFPLLFASGANLGDPTQCAQTYAACGAYYARCTAALQGGGFAVTVSAPAGGVTVAAGTMNLGVASATSICSSLSSVGCPGNGATCGAPTQTGFVVVYPGSGAGRRRTGGRAAVVGMVVGWGIVGLW